MTELIFDTQSFSYGNPCGALTLDSLNIGALLWPQIQSDYEYKQLSNSPFIKDDIVLRNEDKILNFLNLHQEIKTYIPEIKKVIRKYFPTERLEIELVTDFEPEAITGIESIFLYIITGMKPIDALEKLGLLDKEISETLQIDSHFFNTNIEFK